VAGVVLPPIRWRRSPNFSSRHGAAITHLVWHSTAGPYRGSVNWLCDPDADASAHLVVREDGGEVTQLVRLDDKAWHAYPTWNARSVGVEHASRSRGFASRAQELESARIFAWLCHELKIPPVDGLHRPRGIVTHRELGAGGGNHSDGPSSTVWGEFLELVHCELARGGFRKVWAK
jgi:N-acetyl-anhydromuramyl-L-alanine amidase AmpD